MAAFDRKKRKIWLPVLCGLLLLLAVVLSLQFPRGYSDAALRETRAGVSALMSRVNEDRYAIVAVGIRRVPVQTIFGSIEEDRVVVEVMREYAEEVEELLRDQYGDQVCVWIIDCPYNAS